MSRIYVDGAELATTLAVHSNGERFALTLTGANSSKRRPRSDFPVAVFVVLRRLRVLRAVIDEIATSTNGEPTPLTLLGLEHGYTYPIELIRTFDLSDLRLAIVQAQARTARDQNDGRGVTGSPHLRLALRLPELPGATAEQVEDALSSPSTDASYPNDYDDYGRPVTLSQVRQNVADFKRGGPSVLAYLRSLAFVESRWVHDLSDDTFAPAGLVGGSGYNHAAYAALAFATGERWRIRVDRVDAVQAYVRTILGNEFQFMYPRPDRFRFLDLASRTPGRRPMALRPFSLERNAIERQVRSAPARIEDVVAQLAAAARSHDRLLVDLHNYLVLAGWTELCEDPGSIDLVGSHSSGTKCIFEVKTIDDNAQEQIRSAIGQLQEYRYFSRMPNARLCLVVNERLPDESVTFLGTLGMLVLQQTSGRFACLSADPDDLFGTRPA